MKHPTARPHHSTNPAPWKILLAVLILGTCWSGSAQAAGSKLRCIAAYEDAQRLQLGQSFKLAAEKFAFCASAECPTAMHHECATLLDSVRAETPALVFKVLDETGAPVQNVSIAIDEAAVQPFRGEPVSLDPGQYQFTFEAEGYSPVMRRISVPDAGKTQVEIRLPLECGASATDSEQREPEDLAPQPQILALCRERLERRHDAGATQRAPAEPKSRVKTALLLGTSAVGVLGGVGFAYFGLSARGGDRDLATCSPSCSKEAVADVRRDYLLANTALAVGLAGLVGTAVVWFTGNSEHPESQRVSARSWNVQLGMVSTVSTSF